MEINIIIFLTQYCLFAYLLRKYISLAYSENGIWHSNRPYLLDLILVFLPIVNLLTYVVFSMCGSPVESKKEYKVKPINNFLNNFFNIK